MPRCICGEDERGFQELAIPINGGGQYEPVAEVDEAGRGHSGLALLKISAKGGSE